MVRTRLTHLPISPSPLSYPLTFFAIIRGGNPLVPLLLLAAVGGAAAFVATKVKPGSISLPFNLPFTSSSSSTSSRSTSDKGGKGGVVYVVKPKPWWQPVVDAVTGKK